MPANLPPNPSSAASTAQWARHLYEYLLKQTRVRQANDPLPILLPHRTTAAMERAAVDGVLMYQPLYGCASMSVGGEWVPLRSAPAFEYSYKLGAAVNGAAITAGANKIPFSAAEFDDAMWATANLGNNAIDLLQGSYYIEGAYSVAKTSGGAKAFTTYCAALAAPDVPLGSIASPTLYMPAASLDTQAQIIRYAGRLDVPAGGGTYTIICRASATDCRFGTAHGITGYDNMYAQLAISLIGLNE